MIWFGDKRKAKLLAIIFSVVLAAFLAAAGVIWVVQAVKLNTHVKVTAVVVEVRIREDKKTWTAFGYTYKGEEYVVVLQEGSHWMKVDAEVVLMVNPSSPEKAFVLHKDPYTGAWITLGLSGMVGLFAALYWLNYLTASAREKRFLEQGR